MEELIDDPVILARAQATFELIDLAEQMMRQNLRRWHPEETEAEIERRLVSWYRKEPRSHWNGEFPPPAE